MSAAAIGLVVGELLDQHVRLGGVRLAEDRPQVGLDLAELVGAGALVAEVHPVEVGGDRHDRPAHRHARLALVAGLAPGVAEHLDLLALLDVERLAGLVRLERRAHQVHALLGRPAGGRVGGGAPPDALAQPLRVRLEAQQAGRVGEHRPRVGLGEALALEHLEEDLGVAARHVGLVLALGGLRSRSSASRR